jgi:uncharacterized protein (TIGR02996 family)
MTMDEVAIYLAFQEDISAHPDDDTPRLILADWLDEHGDIARAATLRRPEAITFVRDGTDWTLASLSDLTASELDLYKTILSPARDGVTMAVIRRGFVEEITCTCLAWHRKPGIRAVLRRVWLADVRCVERAGGYEVAHPPCPISAVIDEESGENLWRWLVDRSGGNIDWRGRGRARALLLPLFPTQQLAREFVSDLVLSKRPSMDC